MRIDEKSCTVRIGTERKTPCGKDRNGAEIIQRNRETWSGIEPKKYCWQVIIALLVKAKAPSLAPRVQKKPVNVFCARSFVPATTALRNARVRVFLIHASRWSMR